MELSQLRQVVAIAEARSFSRAAEQLSITQPALSRSIAAFEKQCGLRLFERGRKGATCTPAGRLIVDQARGVLAASSALETGIHDLAKGTIGEVAIGMGPLVSSVVLSRLALDLLRSGTAISIHSIVLVPERLLQELLAGRLEVFFGSPWRSESPDVVKTHVGQIRVSLVVRAEHPLADRAKVRTSDLRGRAIANSVNRLSGYLLGAEAPGITCCNHHILRSVALESDCLWFTATDFVREDIEAGRAVVLEVEDLDPPPSEIFMFRRRGVTLSAAASAITEHVTRILNN